MAPVKKANSTTREARLNFRLSSSIKERAALATEISGQSLSDFAASAIARQADEVISRHEIITLANEDRDFFLSILDDDSAPSEKSMDAARRYREGQRKGRIPLVIAHLSREHNRAVFDCDVDGINRYLRENALQDAEKHLSRTFVAPAEQSKSL